MLSNNESCKERDRGSWGWGRVVLWRRFLRLLLGGECGEGGGIGRVMRVKCLRWSEGGWVLVGNCLGVS